MKPYSEADVQNWVRIRASEEGWRLWRNNVGVLKREDGTPVRYGLANDSTAVNRELKSADLIGIRRVLITQDMVGTYIGQFVSIECKPSDWKANSDKRLAAQIKWQELINMMGGHAVITKGENWG